jgi:hypothetical protein
MQFNRHSPLRDPPDRVDAGTRGGGLHGPAAAGSTTAGLADGDYLRYPVNVTTRRFSLRPALVAQLVEARR